MENEFQITKHQHYVCRCYLKRWCVNGIVWCRRNGKNFSTGLSKVALENFFYETKPLDDKKLEFIYNMWIKEQKPLLQTINMGWLSFFSKSDMMIKFLTKINTDNKFDHLLLFLSSNIEEKMHSELETDFDIILHNLIEGNKNYFDEDKQMTLLFILCIQYFRTKNIKQKIIDAGLNNSLETTLNATRWILGTTLAYNIYCPKKYKLVLINNNTSTPFITSDQPIINIFAGINEKPLDELLDEELELYYPLTPSRALLLSFRDVYTNFQSINVDEKGAEKYNDFIKRMSLEFLFAKIEADLE